MKIKNDIIAALDIGSGKVCCMIANKNSEDFCEVIGIGHNESKGINSGIVTDFDLAKKWLDDQKMNISNKLLQELGL